MARPLLSLLLLVALVLTAFRTTTAHSQTELPTPPRVIASNPANHEEITPEQVIQITFDQAMDQASVQSALTISPKLAGRIDWRDDHTLTVTFGAPPTRGESYELRIGTTAKASTGTPLEDSYRLTFDVVGNLKVSQVIPAPDTAQVQAASTITVVFNRPVVPLVNTADQAGLPQPLTFSPDVKGHGEWVNTSIYIFHPDQPLPGGTNFTATVDPNLKDITGSTLAAPYTWKFATLPPQVLSISPVAGATQVLLDQPIQITFNQPMDTTSVESAFTLTDISGAKIEGKITWSSNNQVFTFTPNKRLALGTGHRVVLLGSARSASGAATLSNPFSAAFVTVPYPALVGSQPANGARDVYPGSGIVLQYNTSMDQKSFIGRVHLSPQAENFSINGGGDYLYINFTSLPQTTYAILIDAGVTDIYGNPINTPTTITFTTGSLPPTLNVATREYVSVTNAYNTETFLQAASVNVSRIDGSVFTIAPTDAIRLMTQGRGILPPPVKLIHRIVQPVEGTPNKPTITKLSMSDSGKLPPGLYYFDISSPETSRLNNDYHIAQLLAVSTANVTLKIAPRELLVWVTDLKSGQPVPNAPITIYDQNSQVVFTGKTDADGVYRTLITTNTFADQTVWVVAQADSVYGLASNRFSGVNSYQFGVNYNPYLPKVTEYLYTDQPLYRPGHPVYFRGVLRAVDDVHYSLPSGTTVQVKITNQDGQLVYDKPLKLTEFGTYSGQYDVPQDARLGYYSVQVAYNDQSFGHQFQVAEYRVPEFQVNATAKVDQVVANDTIKVDVDSTFFFGGPVSNAKVTWNALASPDFFNYTGDGDWTFGSYGSPYPYFSEDFGYKRGGYGYGGRSVGSGGGTTDDKGHFVIELPADLGGMNRTQSFIVEATLTDLTNQAISGRTTITVHPATVYVGLRAGQVVAEAGKPTDVKLITVGWDSKPIPGQKVKVTISTESWEQDPKTLEWKQVKTDITGDSVTTDDKGLGTFTFTPAKAGLYRVTAMTTDSANRVAESATYVWVSGPQSFNYGRGDDKSLQLIPDKKLYLPGETAAILIASPFATPVKALVTVERAGIIKTEVIALTGSTTYKLPITEAFAPDVYLSVTLVKGTDDQTPNPDYRSGVVALHTRVKQKLIIKLTPSTDKAKPGDTVRFDVLTTDLDGKPISASVGLSLTDLANLSVAASNSGSIFEAFWSDRGLAVATNVSLVALIDTIIPQPVQALPRAAGISATAAATANQAPAPGVAQGGQFAANDAASEKKEGESQQAAPRLNFVDTPLWAPDVRTDASGHGSIDVKLPDNLTTWRLDGRGISAETYAGQATTDIVSTLPLLVRPSTPRFFVVGDQAELSAVVNNNTDRDLTVDVKLDAKGVTIAGGAQQSITIPKAGRGAVAWRVTVNDVSNVDLAFSAVSGEFKDASKPSVGLGDAKLLPVYKYVAPDYVATAGTLTAAGTRTEGILLPNATAAPTGGELTVRLNTSLAATTLDGLTYLKNFPYQCTEQTISKFLPNIVTYRALEKLGQGTPELKTNLETAISEALVRLRMGQHSDGGWGWYPQEQSNPLVTAYAVLGLLEAKTSNLLTDSQMLDRAVAFLLSTNMQVGRDTPVYLLNQQAFVDFVLVRSGNGNISLLDNLFVQREKMNLFARAFMAQAYALAKGDQSKINALLSDLSNAAILSATGAHWEEARRDWWNWDSDTRTTAIILETLIKLTPNSELIPNVVRWVMVARRGDAWESTQETAWAVMALTDWMAVSGELKGNYAYNVSLNGNGVGDGKAAPETMRDTKTLTLDVKQLLTDRVNRLAVQRGTGDGALYYTATLHVDQPVEAITPTSRGMSFTRQYLFNGKPVTEAKIGDVLTVALDITVPHDLYYVVINDPIPAGVEAVDTSLKTTSQIGQPPQLDQVNPRYGWGWWWFSDTQLRTEKAVLTARYLPAGTYRYTYQVRASQKGTYRVIPPNGQEFYFPEVFGRGAGSLFTVN